MTLSWSSTRPKPKFPLYAVRTKTVDRDIIILNCQALEAQTSGIVEKPKRDLEFKKVDSQILFQEERSTKKPSFLLNAEKQKKFS